MNNALAITNGIKHWGLGGYVRFLPRIKFGVTGQESSPQSPTISYRQTLATMVDENEAVAHRQPVLGRRLLDNMEIRG